MSSGATYWCYTCRQPICLPRRDHICPYCDEGFLQELEELQGGMEERGSEPRIGRRDTIDNFMRQRMGGRYINFGVRRPGSTPLPESWTRAVFIFPNQEVAADLDHNQMTTLVHHNLQLMQCQLLRSHMNTSTQIQSVQFV